MTFHEDCQRLQLVNFRLAHAKTTCIQSWPNTTVCPPFNDAGGHNPGRHQRHLVKSLQPNATCWTCHVPTSLAYAGRSETPGQQGWHQLHLARVRCRSRWPTQPGHQHITAQRLVEHECHGQVQHQGMLPERCNQIKCKTAMGLSRCLGGQPHSRSMARTDAH